MMTGCEEVHDVLRHTNREFLVDRNLLLRQSRHEPGSVALAEWLTQRRAVLATMTAAMLTAHAVWLASQTAQLAGQLLRRAAIPDVSRSLEDLTSASIARFCFGPGSAQAVPAAARGLLDALIPLYASPFMFPSYIRLAQPREWRVRSRLGTLRAELRRALMSSGPQSLAGGLRAQGLDDDAVVRLLISLHLAAHRVPAAALAWALVELGRRPAEQDLAAEAALAWDESEPVPAALHHVIDETLRLWPPNWIATRLATDEVTCGSWTVPAESRILLPFWVVHRLASCYDDPGRFDSRRWERLSPRPGSFVPFGGGPRWCVGERFAYTEMAVILAGLLRRIRVAVNGVAVPDTRHTLRPAGFEFIAAPR